MKQTGILFSENPPEHLLPFQEFLPKSLAGQSLPPGMDLLCASRHGHSLAPKNRAILRQPRKQLLSYVPFVTGNLTEESNFGDY